MPAREQWVAAHHELPDLPDVSPVDEAVQLLQQWVLRVAQTAFQPYDAIPPLRTLSARDRHSVCQRFLDATRYMLRTLRIML